MRGGFPFGRTGRDDCRNATLAEVTKRDAWKNLGKAEVRHKPHAHLFGYGFFASTTGITVTLPCGVAVMENDWLSFLHESGPLASGFPRASQIS